MSDLQIAMIVLGAALVAGVAIFNIVQERRERRRAERAFGSPAADPLLQPGERREPTLGRLEEEDAEPRLQPLETPVEAPPPAAADLEAGVSPTSGISSAVDTVAVILADDPVTREQLEPLLDALRFHGMPVHVEGIVSEQWHPIDTSPRGSWRELRVGLQLASRKGPLGEEAIEDFNQAIAEFAASINAVSQRESPAAAAARAADLDRFCAEADIEVAVNVIGNYGSTFALARVKAIALDHGLSETVEGGLVRFAPDGLVEYTVRRFGDDPAKPAHTYTNGLTLSLDVPQVADAPSALVDMVHLAQRFAAELGGQLVDDNRRPLTEQGLASIRRTLETIVNRMESRGIPAGSPVARRLFA